MNYHILLVEDDPRIRELIEDYFSEKSRRADYAVQQHNQALGFHICAKGFPAFPEHPANPPAIFR